MPRFFKRSVKQPTTDNCTDDSHRGIACANDLHSIQSKHKGKATKNENRLIDLPSNNETAISTETNERVSASSSSSLTSVAGRVSSFVTGLFNMGKGRKKSKTNQPLQQQTQLKSSPFQYEKHQQGKKLNKFSQDVNKKDNHNEFTSKENRPTKEKQNFSPYKSNDDDEVGHIVITLNTKDYNPDGNNNNGSSDYLKNDILDKNCKLDSKDEFEIFFDSENVNIDRIERELYDDSIDTVANDVPFGTTQDVDQLGDNANSHTRETDENNSNAETKSNDATLVTLQHSRIEIDSRGKSDATAGDRNIIYNFENVNESSMQSNNHSSFNERRNQQALPSENLSSNDAAEWSSASFNNNESNEIIYDDRKRPSSCTLQCSIGNNQNIQAPPSSGDSDGHDENYQSSDAKSQSNKHFILGGANSVEMGQQQSQSKQNNTRYKNSADKSSEKKHILNENNKILEYETSTLSQPQAYAAETKKANNEIKDAFYENSSERNEEIIQAPHFVSSEQPVNLQQTLETVKESSHNNFERQKSPQQQESFFKRSNINDGGEFSSFESVSNEKISRGDSELCRADVTVTNTDKNVGTSPAKARDREKNISNQIGSENADYIKQFGVKKECDAAININRDCENQAQMEQNFLYRVDSYNSDDTAELSDIEETVIDANGKVVEVKTIFKQRPVAKSANDSQFKANKSSEKCGFRTIGARRRSNSISSSLDIQIIEVDSDQNIDLHSQQPLINFVDDDSGSIRLSDLRDNNVEKDCESNRSVPVVEIVEQLEDSSEDEYEEIEEEEEIEYEEIEEEEEEEEEEEVSTESAPSNSNTKSHSIELPGDSGVQTNNKILIDQSAFKVNPIYSNHSINHECDKSRMGSHSENNGNVNTTNLSNSVKTNDADNSDKRFNSHNIRVQNEYSNADKSHSMLGANLFHSSHNKPNESSPQQKCSEDAMHLPDIVIGSTSGNRTHLSPNLNVPSKTSNGYSVQTIRNSMPLSRSPPKIMVNDTTTWDSTATDQTEPYSDDSDENDSIDVDSIEIDNEDEIETSENSESIEQSHQSQQNAAKTDKNEFQSQIQNETKQYENSLLAQIDEAKRNATDYQRKIADLTYKISELERELTIKSWNVDRLQAELEAAYKELNCVKMKLKLQEAELEESRQKRSDREDDFNFKYNGLEADHLELKEKLDRMQALAISLQIQLSTAQAAVDDLQAERERLKRERDEEKQALQDALDAAIIERAQNDAKWQRDFEQLRTLNSDREELLLQDCEWKIRATERSCKARISAAETARNEALQDSERVAKEAQAQYEKVEHLKTCEAEVAALRGLTGEQRESINYLTEQLEIVKAKLDEATEQLEEAHAKIRKMALQFASTLSDKDREMIAKIDEARGEVASMWEDRLLNEMLRLKIELETCYAEDRVDALRRAHEEHIADVNQLKDTFAFREQLLRDEVDSIKSKLADRNRRLDEANEKADKQIVQIRMILNKSEQDHQREFNAQASHHEDEIESLKSEFKEKEAELREEYESKLEEIKKKCADELTATRNEMLGKLKREYESRYEKFKADKEDEQQDLQRSYKRKLVNADEKIRDIEILHQREIKDIQNAHSMERSSLEQRDLQNSQEIETLHRKCRCLTQLFEEMRIRYERRDPRAEDIREIQELKSVIEAQDKDLRNLTEKLREMQMHRVTFNDNNGVAMCGNPMDFEHQQQQFQQPQQQLSPNTIRKMKKPKMNCDVIYEEENEDQESHGIST